MRKVTLAIDLDYSDILGADMAAVLSAAAKVRAETGGARRIGYVNRLRQGVIAVQLHRLGAGQYAIAEATGQGMKGDRPQTTYVKHLISIGALLLHGVDANGEHADLVETFANTKRHTGKAYAAEKAYVLNTPTAKFDVEHLRTLMGDATISDLDREDATLAGLIAKAPRVATDTVPNLGTGEGATEGESTETTPETPDVLAMIATLGQTIDAHRDDLNLADILSALAALSTRVMAKAPAIVESQVA